MEGATRGTFVLAHRSRGLENEGSTEAIEKPLGIPDAVNAHAKGAS
jgi:hypothetical protein